MMEISELVGAWPVVLHLHRMGELRREDIVWALRSGEPMPPQAAPLLADIIEKKYKFKRGRKGTSKLSEVAVLCRFLELEEKSKPRPMLRGETAYTHAISTIESEGGPGSRTVQKIVKHRRRRRNKT